MTSDERRKVAERLRRRANDDLGGLSFQRSLAKESGASDESWRGVMRHLAGLIDPTCEIMRPATPDKFGVCSACGALVNVRDSVADATESLRPHYCPNCGARVVRGDGR